MTAPPPEVTFVLCIEQNALRAQALLLCETIRQFGGRHADASILAFAPRPGYGVDAATKRALAALAVEYVDEPLNLLCPEYGSANRVFSAARAETLARTEWLVVLDSDTLVLDELQLPADADVAVRPVDTRGSATTGHVGDSFFEYWQRMAALGGISLERLPWMEPTDRGSRIRASYNGGLVVVRRERRLLQAWADLFARSVTEGLKPWRGSGLDVRASTGRVGTAAGEYWGSNQAALAVTVWSLTDRVHVYPDSYNVPLHMLVDRRTFPGWPVSRPLVHVHYHWLLTAPTHEDALTTLEGLGVQQERIAWLRERLPLLESGNQVPESASGRLE